MTLLVGKKLNKITNEGHPGLMFWCPACDAAHLVYVDGTKRHDGVFPPNWEWNGDGDKPTFWPSINCSPNDPKWRCHSWVRDGMITFCGDSHHEFKNQTLPIPDWDSA